MYADDLDAPATATSQLREIRLNRRRGDRPAKPGTAAPVADAPYPTFTSPLIAVILADRHQMPQKAISYARVLTLVRIPKFTPVLARAAMPGQACRSAGR
jgi:hypothetical protein